MGIMIGVPVHNDRESFQAMIKSLKESTSHFDVIYIVESGSTDKTDELCDELAIRDNRIEVVHTRKEGPLKAYNKIFNEAKKRKMDLLLTQTDVLFPKLFRRDWLEIMSKQAQHESIGAVTCINGGGISGPDYVNGFRWLGGWCSYYPFRTLEKIGGYDESFPNGFGVDIDHTYSIMDAGLHIMQINYWVDHHGLNERLHDRSSNSEQMKKASAIYFKKKWKLNLPQTKT